MTKFELLEIAKPILFNTEMVCAILEGRKTETRRVVKLDLGLADTDRNDKNYLMIPDEYGEYHHAKDLCRYKKGDILWVRETWADLHGMGFGNKTDTNEPWIYAYLADSPKNSESFRISKNYGVKWHPSIHMPKEAARIFLRVTAVRVERLQDILCSGMRAEGCIPTEVTGGQWQQWQNDYFKPLWNSTIKKQDASKYSWAANPWVWVCEFEKVIY